MYNGELQYKLAMITSFKSVELSSEPLTIPETLLTFHWCFSSYFLYT